MRKINQNDILNCLKFNLNISYAMKESIKLFIF